MDVRQLAAVVGDIAETDLDRFNCDELLERLADSIRKHAGVNRDLLHSAIIEQDRSQPDPDGSLFGGTIPQGVRTRQRYVTSACLANHRSTAGLSISLAET